MFLPTVPALSRPGSASAALALALLAPASVGAAREPVYALVNARIVTVSGPTIGKGTLVLRNGVVAALGPDATIPPNARVLDAEGLTLTPGLIDAFGGLGLPAPARRGGGRSEERPQSPAASPSPLAAEALVLDRIGVADALEARDSGITTALVVPREGIVPGRSVLLSLAGQRPEELAWRQPFALHLHMATLRRQYPSSLMGTLAYARQALHDARRYGEEWSAYEKSPAGKRRPAYDAGHAVWLDVLAGRLPLVVTAHRENDVRRALALADEFGIRLLVAGAPHAHRLADLVKARKLPLLVTVNYDPPRAPSFGSFGGDTDEEREREEIEEAEGNPAALHEAGVRFALVSAHARDFLAGVRKAIERGLPREAALRAVTLSAAEALGIADRTGSLDVGKAANVVAWSGEPLTKDSRARMVFVDGRLHEPAERTDSDEKRRPSVAPER